jgi:hypothetical protein
MERSLTVHYTKVHYRKVFYKMVLRYKTVQFQNGACFKTVLTNSYTTAHYSILHSQLTRLNQDMDWLGINYTLT